MLAHICMKGLLGEHLGVIGTQVCKALCGLHQRDIVHGDLRPANVMWFSSSFSMKLVDFARWSDKGLPTPLAINLRYAAPEV